jgi:hypothetical protein
MITTCSPDTARERGRTAHQSGRGNLSVFTDMSHLGHMTSFTLPHEPHGEDAHKAFRTCLDSWAGEDCHAQVEASLIRAVEDFLRADGADRAIEGERV